MAVRAANVTLGNLSLKNFQRDSIAHHSADITLLRTANMVEFEDHGVSLAAVNAGMHKKVVAYVDR